MDDSRRPIRTMQDLSHFGPRNLFIFAASRLMKTLTTHDKPLLKTHSDAICDARWVHLMHPARDNVTTHTCAGLPRNGMEGPHTLAHPYDVLCQLAFSLVEWTFNSTDCLHKLPPDEDIQSPHRFVFIYFFKMQLIWEGKVALCVSQRRVLRRPEVAWRSDVSIWVYGGVCIAVMQVEKCSHCSARHQACNASGPHGLHETQMLSAAPSTWTDWRDAKGFMAKSIEL